MQDAVMEYNALASNSDFAREAEFWEDRQGLGRLKEPYRMTIPSRRLDTRRGHSPLEFGSKALRPVSFLAGDWKPFRMLTGGNTLRARMR